MAQAPAPMASATPDPSASMGAMGGAPDPSAGGDTGGDVVVTICKAGDGGGYTVYAGDEPDAGGGADMSEDDADAMGDGGGAPSAQGQPADSIGAALKIALDIMQGDASSAGAPGSADDQFSAGFAAPKSPTLASGPKQKF